MESLYFDQHKTAADKLRFPDAALIEGELDSRKGRLQLLIPDIAVKFGAPHLINKVQWIRQTCRQQRMREEAPPPELKATEIFKDRKEIERCHEKGVDRLRVARCDLLARNKTRFNKRS